MEKKNMTKLLPLFVFFFLLMAVYGPVIAEECSPSCNGIEECQQKIDECQKLLSMSVSATKPHEEKIREIENNISAIEANVRSLSAQIVKKEIDISKGEGKLTERQTLLEVEVRDLYKKDFQSSLDYLLSTLFAKRNVGETVQILVYRQGLIDQQKTLIAGLVMEITDLSEAKKKLEDTQRWLASKKINLEVTLTPIRDLVKGAKAYQSKLTQTVGTLSARQQQLLAEKTGSFMTSVGEVPPADDAASRPDFNPGFSPAFAGFSFGAPHRKGMSQYGAFGRAKSGQSAEEILKAYYGGLELKKDYNTGIQISVSGFGSYDLESYAKRIYEMPGSWGDEGGFEALKAQAVAARSYALAYTNNGSGSICATESCQVFKPGEKGGKWNEAVDATRGWVLVSGGQPFSAWYAASSGGFNYSYSAQGHTTPGGWDTKCGNQGCWTGEAYEKISGSPWFYKAWYKPRGRSGSRSHPWLKTEEFVDIVNCVLLYVKDSGTLSHLSQTDKSNSDTWSADEVRNKLGGEAINNVSEVSVSYNTSGVTGSVHLGTDKGGKDINGEKFREIFNIRAPGEIYIPSALYNIERK